MYLVIAVAVIVVDPYQADDVISGITVHRFREIGRTRGVCPQIVVQSPFNRYVIISHAPQRTVIFVSTEVFTPPEPAAGILVPRAENAGYRIAVRILYGLQEIREPVQPLHEKPVALPALEDRAYCHVGRHVPGITAGKGVAQMPREGNDAAGPDEGRGLGAHQVERDSVQIGIVPEFDPSKVKAHNGRKIPAYIQDIAPAQRVGDVRHP